MTQAQWLAFCLVRLVGIILLGAIVYFALPRLLGLELRLVIGGLVALVVWWAARRIVQMD